LPIEHKASEQAVTEASWSTAQVYTMAAVCLVLGLALGYLFRGSKSTAAPTPAPAPAAAAPSPPPAEAGGGHPAVTLEQMKQMADTKAAPLLDQLKKNPNNASQWIQVARMYEATHQFKEAATYYGKALQITPKDVSTRTQMASCLYYDGDVEGAIAQLQQALQNSPNDANALFNLGMIKWKGKNDAAGAVATWRQLLNSNPKLADDKKAQVQKLITEAGQPLAAN